jgi:DNA polymerase-3 subunit alpha
MNFFDAMPGEAAAEPVLPEIPEWPQGRLAECEKESLGFYVKHHPLAAHASAIRHFATATTGDVPEMAQDTEVVLGGLIKSVRPIVTKTGKNIGAKMAVFDLEDLAGSIGCVIFPNQYAQCQDLVQADRVVFVVGRVDRQREEPQIRTSEVLDIETGRKRFSRAVVIRLHEEALNDEMLMTLKETLAAHPGPLPLYIELASRDHGRTLIRAGEGLSVSMDASLQKDLDNLLGDGHLVLAANGTGHTAKV